MYHYLTGRLIEKLPTAVILDVAGVGYHIQIPTSSYKVLPEAGQSVRILTHFVVREDSQTLYGFFTEEERHLFRLLISVSGIGPKMAITLLSGIAIPDLKQAIVDGSLEVLSGVPGVGRKTAERLVVELREKIVLDERRVAIPAALRFPGREQLIEDSLQALVSLGYQKRVAKEAIQKALQASKAEKFTAEDLIRTSLKHV